MAVAVVVVSSRVFKQAARTRSQQPTANSPTQGITVVGGMCGKWDVDVGALFSSFFSFLRGRSLTSCDETCNVCCVA